MDKVRCNYARACREKTCPHYPKHAPESTDILKVKLCTEGQVCTHTRIGGYFTVTCQPVPSIPNLLKGEHSGKCDACHIRYIWRGQPQLKDAGCPGCGKKLNPTTYLFKGTICRTTPITKR